MSRCSWRWLLVCGLLVPALGTQAQGDGSEDIPLFPLLPGQDEPPPPMEPPPDERPAPPPPEPDAPGDAPVAEVPRAAVGRAYRLTPWAGALLPVGRFGAGPAAGVTVSAVLEGAVEGRLDFSWMRVSRTGSAEIPGRGLDVGYAVQSNLMAVSVGANVYLTEGAARLYLGFAAGPLWSASRSIVFSEVENGHRLGVEALAAVGLRLDVGTGSVQLEAAFQSADLAAGDAGSVSGFRFTAGYGFSL